ncbi:MAG: DUF4286 family protein [Bacteroidales bacterium]
MFIINLTFCISEHIQAAWLMWMQKEVLPQISQKTYCAEVLFLRVLADAAQAEHSYSVQIKVPHATEVQKLTTKDLPLILEQLQNTFPQEIYFFKTILKQIDVQAQD